VGLSINFNVVRFKDEIVRRDIGYGDVLRVLRVSA
jgi:hypothetical protein